MATMKGKLFMQIILIPAFPIISVYAFLMNILKIRLNAVIFGKII